MKSRHSPNLYEILRSAAAPKESPAPPAEAPAASAVAVAPPPPPVVVPAPEPVIEAPPPPPPPAPRYVPPPAAVPAPVDMNSSGPGERSLRVTYNTALFGGLVVLGALFLAFTLGVRTGRAPAEQPPATPGLDLATPQAPALPPPKFTIRLVEYRARKQEEHTKALDAVYRFKNELDRLGLREGVIETLGQGADRRVVLRYGEYTDASSATARETLQKLKTLKLEKGAKEATFARTAQFQTR